MGRLARGQGLHGRHSAEVQIAPEALCKGGKV